MFFLLISTLTSSNLRYKTVANRSFYIRFCHHIPAASSTLLTQKRKNVNCRTTFMYFTKIARFTLTVHAADL